MIDLVHAHEPRRKLKLQEVRKRCRRHQGSSHHVVSQRYDNELSVLCPLFDVPCDD